MTKPLTALVARSQPAAKPAKRAAAAPRIAWGNTPTEIGNTLPVRQSQKQTSSTSWSLWQKQKQTNSSPVLTDDAVLDPHPQQTSTLKARATSPPPAGVGRAAAWRRRFRFSRSAASVAQATLGDRGALVEKQEGVVVRPAAARPPMPQVESEWTATLSGRPEQQLRCTVCYDSFSEAAADGHAAHLGIWCGGSAGECHFLCTDCLQSYVEAEAEEGRCHALRCPALCCGHPYDHIELRASLNESAWACFTNALDHAAQRCVGERAEICPNPGCGAIFDNVSGGTDDTIIGCRACGWHYCARCRQRLDLEAECFSHTCPDRGRQGIEEVLSYGQFAHCGNKACTTRGLPVEKRHFSECNAMKCSSCLHYLCYLCDSDLGEDWEEAHRTYDPTHPLRLHAPCSCPLFNSEDNHEVAVAVRRRTEAALGRFLGPLSTEERRQVLRDARPVLLERGVRLPGDAGKCGQRHQVAGVSLAAAGAVFFWHPGIAAALLAVAAGQWLGCGGCSCLPTRSA